MSLSKWGGAVWLFAAVFSVVITVIYRTDRWQWPVTIIAGVAAAIVGALLVWRPIRGIVIWSGVVGVAWLVVYALLTYWQRGEQIAWTTDVTIGALGGIASAFSVTRSPHPG